MKQTIRALRQDKRALEMIVEEQHERIAEIREALAEKELDYRDLDYGRQEQKNT